MAQRVYLIPVDPAFVESITAAVLAPSDDGVTERLNDLRARARPQERALALSRRFSKRLNDKAFQASNRTDQYGLYTAMRPYLTTARTANDAASRTDALYSAADDSTRVRLLESELAELPPELYADDFLEPE